MRFWNFTLTRVSFRFWKRFFWKSVRKNGDTICSQNQRQSLLTKKWLTLLDFFTIIGVGENWWRDSSFVMRAQHSLHYKETFFFTLYRLATCFFFNFSSYFQLTDHPYYQSGRERDYCSFLFFCIEIMIFFVKLNFFFVLKLRNNEFLMGVACTQDVQKSV